MGGVGLVARVRALIKTVWCFLGRLKRGAEKWFQFKLVRGEALQIPGFKASFLWIRRNAQSDFMWHGKTTIKT